MKIRKNNRGFTLVELLLVMAIIGILAGIIFISIGSARKRARITTFKESMKNIAVAATQCTDAEGTLAINAVANGTVNLCTLPGGGDGGIGTIPLIKKCDGTAGNMTVGATASDATGDDFIIQSVCPVASGPTVECYAQCSANGCTFNNGSYVDDGGDGCPRT